MKTSLAIKTLFRTVGKTVFTFLLIAVLIFSLFIQLSEYFKTAAEFKANVELYSGTGYVEYRPAVYKGGDLRRSDYIWTDPRVGPGDALTPDVDEIRYPALSAETVEAIAALPYVSSVEKRYMTAGVSPDYMRMMEDRTRYDYNNRLIVEGTVEGVGIGEDGWPSIVMLSEPKLLAGDVALEDLLYDRGEGVIMFYVVDEVFPYGDDTAFFDYGEENPWGPEIYREGERYAVVCNFTRRMTNHSGINVTRQSLTVGVKFSDGFCPSVWNITDAPENYLDLPEYAPLKKLIEITKADLHTFDVVYAEDMSAIQRVHDNTLYLVEGRWLTPEDTANDAKVCVVERTLAKQYNLNLGDKLSLDLGHELFEQFYTLGAIAGTEERFSQEWTAAEFEIVGFYTGSTFAKDANEPNWAYSMNTVFVPMSSFPLRSSELEGHEYAPGEVTFLVDDAWDIGPFLEESAPQIGAMGLTLTFDDGGWMQVLEDYHNAQRLPLIRIVLLAFVTVTGIALSVYLFVSRKKKDYAVMRALGTPKGRAAKALLAPITVLTLAAALVALVAGTVYCRARLGAVSASAAAICGLGALALTLLFAGFNIRGLSKKPPLLLLQDSKARKAKKTGAAAAVATVSAPAASAADSSPAPARAATTVTPAKSEKDPADRRFVLRYVWRHIRRQGLKSALAVLLAALMVGAVVQFGSLRATYREMRETTVVKVQFTRSLSLNRLQPLVEEGFAKDVYYERNASISCLVDVTTTYEDTPIVITSDLDRYLNQGYEISLGEGYTQEDLGKMDYVLLGADLMAQRGLKPGDVVRLGTKFDFDAIIARYKSTYLYSEYYSQFLEPERDPTVGELIEYYGKDFERSLDSSSAKAVVIGSITTETGSYQNAVFTAGIDDTTSLVGTYQSMPLVEFILADNSRAEELRARCEEMTGGRRGAYAMDTAALESVERTSDLLGSLYPAVVALALLIGAAMCVLLVMQTTKDAAIMRAQGTTRRKTRAMLAVEQILLGVFGILLGLLVMLVWKRGAFAAVALQAMLFALGYALMLLIGSFASAALAMKKNILELLQTKE